MPKQICYPARSTDGVNWTDVTPRIGAAYDLFGNGKTAVKVNVGKYVQALTASNSDMDLNPLIRLNLMTTRTWNDRGGLGIDGDYVPQCDLLNTAANGECGAMVNQNFGKEFFTRTFDPNFIHGYGVRPYNWEMGVSVQQEVAPRVGVTVGYYRRWFGNFYTLDNTLTTASDYTQFSVPIPVDSRLPGGGGGVVSGIYNINPNKVGQVQDLAQLTSNFGDEPTENWHGVDVGVNARLRNGLTVQAGTSTGRTLQDNCALRSVLPETYPWSTITVTQSLRGDSTAGLTRPYCRIVEPFLTSFRGLATYVVPKVDVQVSGDVAERPGRRTGGQLRGDQCDCEQRAAAARPQPLVGEHHRQPDSERHAVLAIAATISISGRRRSCVSAGRARRSGSTSTTSRTATPSRPTTRRTWRRRRRTLWLTPTTIATARYVKFNFQIDF